MKLTSSRVDVVQHAKFQKSQNLSKVKTQIIQATVNGGNGNWKRNSETGNGRQFKIFCSCSLTLCIDMHNANMYPKF